ncbi:2-hydroxyacid dehydrogenase [Burkholderia sp. Ac-20379]|uniref:2-hydroxyacid dehydrogenase n=1 Tax=Burkholderia sp. Ac-20379 TaxID=2703900 RepID=UPI00198233A3|nr:glyoxylate/hydroxypyruvate reductase A [Burkholderia sp. Ac-20379]MBN3722937.1 glyoxylate/hydroxypyruvate reductase A [Burkholderia sp. Ac-20379]
MTRIAFLSDGFDLSPLFAPLRERLPGLRIAGADTDPHDADIAVCWRPPAGALARLPSLRLVHSIAAGVDHILADPALPAVPVCRVVDPAHAQGMGEFVMWAVLHFHREFDRVLANQRERRWQRYAQVAAGERSVGVMGLGALGLHVARQLADAGFRVRGWSRERKAIEGVETFGADAFDAFLAGSELLVCLLPLTADTRGIVDRRLLARLPRGAKLIHVGRGEHLVPDDVLAALEDGALGGAVIDVFEREPLPEDDPFWRAPNLIVTPHMASVASFERIAAQIAANVLRLRDGAPLENQVDVARGY